MASGHVSRTNRPNHMTATNQARDVQILLANGKPSAHSGYREKRGRPACGSRLVNGAAKTKPRMPWT
jgi:hypothetical protein